MWKRKGIFSRQIQKYVVTAEVVSWWLKLQLLSSSWGCGMELIGVPGGGI